MADFNDEATSGSSKKQRLIPDLEPVKFQILADIQRNDATLASGLVLPRVVYNNLGRDCRSITIVDSKKGEFGVMVEECESGDVKLSKGNWASFVRLNVLGDLDITTLCFKLVREKVFQVICLIEFGLEVCKKEKGKVSYKRCLFVAKATTVNKQLLPAHFLTPLNEKHKMKPEEPAYLAGPRQDGEIEVIYSYRPNNPPKNRWRAVGFKGSKWTTFVMENRIEKGCKVLLTAIKERGFGCDVFNEQGIGLSFHTFKKHMLMNWLESHHDRNESSEDESDDDHECKVLQHRHRDSKPSFLIDHFPDHGLTHKRLTIPKEFVYQHEVHNYNSALLVYGKLQFPADLISVLDSRRPGDRTHVVIKYEWGDFLETAGLVVGDPIRFELLKERSVVGGVAVFRLC